MKTGFLRIFIVCFLMASVSGCLDETYTVVINEDGSGTVKIERVVDDRITVMLEEVDKLAEFPFFDFAELGQMIMEGAQTLEQNGFTIADNQSQTLDDGTLKISFTASFDSAQALANSDIRQEVPVFLSRNEASELVIAADLIPMKPEDSPAPDDEVPLGIMYGMLKGYHRTITVTVPAALETGSGELSPDKNTVSWEFDLRNRAALDKARELFAKTTMGTATATAALQKLAANLPEFKQPEAAAAPAEEEEPAKQAAPEKRPASGKYVLEVDSVEARRVRPLNPPGDAEVTDLYLNLKLTWGGDVAFLRHEEPKIAALKDDTGNDIELSGTSTSSSGDEETPGTTVQLYLYGVGPEAKKLVNVSGTLPVVSAKDIKKVKLTLEELQQADGQETTGIAALDALQGAVHDLSESSFNVRFGEEDPDNNASILRAVMVTKSGEREEAWSTSCMWGDCSISFSTALAEAESIELEIPGGETVEELPFSMAEVLLP